MTRARWIGAALIVLGLITLWSTFYTVSETEQVVITQFGQPIGRPVTQAGLHIKVPFAQEVNVFDKRWLEWDGNANQVPTRDKKYIWVDTYARWRIADPLLFFQRLRDERGAQSRLDDIIDGETRNVIASHNLIEVVRSSNRAFERAEEVEDVMEAEAMRQVEYGRDKITRLILERASHVMPDYGIELVDLQVQRVNYVESVQTKVFERMISERKRIADPLLFFQRLRDERGAQSRLDDIIDGETRNVIASHNLIEVVRSSNRAFERAEEVEDVMETEAMRQVEFGRDKITRLILERASHVMHAYGIELVALQVQRVNYVESVQTKVFERMISERKRIADRHRSEGQGKSAEIRGKKESELKVLESEAYRKTQEIMGRGDAEAVSIYADANNRDRELYRFLRTMETYRATVDKDTWLMLSTDADVFRYLQSSKAVAATGPQKAGAR